MNKTSMSKRFFGLPFFGKVIFVLLLLFPQQSSAQLKEFLLLEKPGTNKRIRYYNGDNVTFMLKDRRQFFTKQIVGLSDTSFFVKPNTEIFLDEVEALADRSKGRFFQKISRIALVIAPGLILLSAANNIIQSPDGAPLVEKNVYPYSIGFGALGVAGLLYNGRRYRLKNRWRIIVVRH